MRITSKRNKLLIHTVLIFGSLVMILPFIWMILTSGKTLDEAMSIPPIIFPTKFQWGNFSSLLESLPFIQFYLNTFLMAIGRVVGAVLFSAMAGYAFARIEFPFKNFLFTLVLMQMMVPGQLFIIPQYVLIQKLNLLDSIWALIIPGLVSVFGTFLLRQFFMSLPREIEEAAMLDGCNIWQTFFKVMLPLARSGLISLGIFTALFSFKDLMWPLIVNVSQDKMTLSSGLATIQGQYAVNYPQLMAGSLLAIWPMIVVFIIFQKQFIEGVANTGGKL